MNTSPSTHRLSNIDITRGAVMVLMTLDHARDFFGDHSLSALNLAETSTALFFSRWITHLCAPMFVFLAGSSIFLKAQKTKVNEMVWFLVSRGFFLIVFEQTLLRCLGWYFNVDYHYMNANVLWGIGGSMILLAAFIFLPGWVSLVTGLLIVVSHDGLEQLVSLSDGQSGYVLWTACIKGGNMEFLPGYNFYVSYPFLPWFGIMALGYGLGTVFTDDTRKVKWHHWAFIFLGVFMIVRALNVYGNPTPWQTESSNWFTVLSFINLEKYPPSMLYSLLTLGIGFLFLSVSEKMSAVMKGFLSTLGRVPLFFYTAHILLIHALAVVVAWMRYGRAEWLYRGPGIFWDETLPGHPADYGLSLEWVVLISVLVVGMLYPLCKWFADLKERNNSKWLRYF